MRDDDDEHEDWLDADGYACVRGCPDDMCRASGTCAWLHLLRDLAR